MPQAPSPQADASAPALAQAMILAAGRGQRMRPLTDHTPKPLLMVRGQPLLAWHLAAMASAGIDCVLINTGWLGEQIPARLGSHFVPANAGHPGAPQPAPAAVQLRYSREDLDFGGGIETAGGIARALPQLQKVFWLIAGDVYAPQFRFDPQARARFAASDALAHLWLVPNPPHHRRGDFLLERGLARPLPEPANASDAQPGPPHCRHYTYSTIALLKQALFAPPWCELPRGNPEGQAAALGPLLQRAARAGRVSASLYHGDWTDVGTPQRLAALNQPPA
ncbi:nucleotidyltransferase [Vandammella animalimorsus]|uniref:Nucleotidyltransferase n=1 Tax=Vandammella animalimorsus TaxID=2029117 RepID=A0A2A2AJK4_9BURK|nr:NTP transferase domain-containing protein [Vandammella animalimorsus]PAT37892.1 nucleotidyltransferase [Vandammella animalimorsus]